MPRGSGLGLFHSLVDEHSNLPDLGPTVDARSPIRKLGSYAFFSSKIDEMEVVAVRDWVDPLY